MEKIRTEPSADLSALKDLFDNVPVGVGIAAPVARDGTIRMDARILYYNKEWVRLFGFDAREVRTVEQATQRLYPDPRMLEAMLRLRREAAQRRQNGKDDERFEAKAMGADGQWISVVTGTAVIQRMMIVSMMDVAARERAQGPLSAALRQARGESRMAVRRGGSAVRMVDRDSIAAVTADGKYSRVIAETELPDARTLMQWERLLEPRGFARIDRSTLVCPAKIQSILPFGRGARVAFAGSTVQIEVGRAGRERLGRLLLPSAPPSPTA